SCDEANDTCVHVNNTASCDDGMFCTVNDTCSEGVCSGSPRNCDDNNPCTYDSCDEDNDVCVHENNDANACDDGLYCTVNDACSNGVCSGSPRTCNPYTPLTRASCDEANDTCVHVNNTAPCDDGLFCTVNDTCSEG